VALLRHQLQQAQGVHVCVRVWVVRRGACARK
jgi:hypothetical protein